MSFESYVSTHNKLINLSNDNKNLFRKSQIYLSGYIPESPGVFRGSKYNNFIRNITDYSLESSLEPVQIKTICNSIEKYLMENKGKTIDFTEITEIEIQSLLLYFTICYKNNFYIVCDKFVLDFDKDYNWINTVRL